MEISQWVTVTRDDSETVGYLEPVTEDYDLVQPRSILGHAVGEPTDHEQGEALLCERGIAELMDPWHLSGATQALSGNLSILEVSAHGIVVADALLTKALVPTERHTVPWPDTDEVLTRSTDG